jgi:hypothetical protein
MLTWFSEAFAANSSKAQLVTVVVSATIAILVLLLNQHFTARRSRKDVLIRKIEELYQSAISYERHARALLAGIYRGRLNSGRFELDRTALDAMNDEVERIEMLLGLYFPSVSFEKARYYAGPTLPVMEIAVKRKEVSEDEALDASERTKDNIARNAAEIKAICAGLMRTNTH